MFSLWYNDLMIRSLKLDWFKDIMKNLTVFVNDIQIKNRYLTLSQSHYGKFYKIPKFKLKLNILFNFVLKYVQLIVINLIMYTHSKLFVLKVGIEFIKDYTN